MSTKDQEAPQDQGKPLSRAGKILEEAARRASLNQYSDSRVGQILKKYAEAESSHANRTNSASLDSTKHSGTRIGKILKAFDEHGDPVEVLRDARRRADKATAEAEKANAMVKEAMATVERTTAAFEKACAGLKKAQKEKYQVIDIASKEVLQAQAALKTAEAKLKAARVDLKKAEKAAAASRAEIYKENTKAASQARNDALKQRLVPLREFLSDHISNNPDVLKSNAGISVARKKRAVREKLHAALKKVVIEMELKGLPCPYATSSDLSRDIRIVTEFMANDGELPAEFKAKK